MRKTIWRNFDLPLLLVTLVLVAIGEVMIYSSYESAIPSTSWVDNSVIRQGIAALFGLFAAMVLAALDYHIFAALQRWIYLLALGILGFTAVIGHTSFGAQSWLLLQTWTLQPSELCKVMMIIVLAGFLGRDAEALENPGPLLLSTLLILPPAVLIYLQPDFGTALILLATWAGMIFLAGVRWRHIALLAGIGLVLTPLVWIKLQGYMRERIALFLFPGADPSGKSYNVTQALISIGSGGWWGKGLLHGTQSQLYFLRVRHTDFIFSVLAEEMGFIGSVVFLILFVFLILRLIRIAMQARDAHGRLIVGGVASMLLIQTVINLGMNANLLPASGLPLPFVSYGGSSLLATLMAIGLVQSVAMRRKGAESGRYEFT
jgi:rod shape determining protein RodA